MYSSAFLDLSIHFLKSNHFISQKHPLLCWKKLPALVASQWCRVMPCDAMLSLLHPSLATLEDCKLPASLRGLLTSGSAWAAQSVMFAGILLLERKQQDSTQHQSKPTYLNSKQINDSCNCESWHHVALIALCVAWLVATCIRHHLQALHLCMVEDCANRCAESSAICSWASKPETSEISEADPFLRCHFSSRQLLFLRNIDTFASQFMFIDLVYIYR